MKIEGESHFGRLKQKLGYRRHRAATHLTALRSAGSAGRLGSRRFCLPGAAPVEEPKQTWLRRNEDKRCVGACANLWPVLAIALTLLGTPLQAQVACVANYGDNTVSGYGAGSGPDWSFAPTIPGRSPNSKHFPTAFPPLYPSPNLVFFSYTPCHLQFLVFPSFCLIILMIAIVHTPTV
jgi:hypothetical protein